MAGYPLRLIFMGTPVFAVPTLRAIANREDLAQIVAVYTQPDRPAGRGQMLQAPAVKAAAQELGLPVFQPQNVNVPDERRRIADLLPDLAVVAAYSQFLSKGLLSIPRLGCFNVHSSLLPKYRGAAPIQYALWNGEAETGVTIIRLVSKMDAGPMLGQKSIPIEADISAPVLQGQLAEIGAELMVQVLEQLKSGFAEEKEQNEAEATFAKLITKEDGLIAFTKTGRQILCQMQALNPWPGTFIRTTKGLMKILNAKFYANLGGLDTAAVPGTICIEGSRGVRTFFVRCLDGWLEVMKLQPEGRKPMSAADFLNGLQDEGMRLL